MLVSPPFGQSRRVACPGDAVAAVAIATLERRMTSEDIAAAETLARNWAPDVE